MCICVFVYLQPASPEAILELLKFGNGNRTQHATDANSESSRSHAVLQVFIIVNIVIVIIVIIVIIVNIFVIIPYMQVFLRQKDKTAGLSGEVKVAKMSLIDLAGSEKGQEEFECVPCLYDPLPPYRPRSPAPSSPGRRAGPTRFSCRRRATTRASRSPTSR
jgi:hypothetical protein